jgi:5'-nucleotidase
MATPDLRILHFNDVYHIEPRSGHFCQSMALTHSERDPVGGAARFVTVINEYRDKARYAGQPDLLILFSGDAFNPSIESTVTKAL